MGKKTAGKDHLILSVMLIILTCCILSISSCVSTQATKKNISSYEGLKFPNVKTGSRRNLSSNAPSTNTLNTLSDKGHTNSGPIVKDSRNSRIDNEEKVIVEEIAEDVQEELRSDTVEDSGKRSKRAINDKNIHESPFAYAVLSPKDTDKLSEELEQERYQRMLDTALEIYKTAQDLWDKGRFNESLNALDEAYSLILKVSPSKEEPEILQQKEDLRFLIAKRIMEIHASRFTVANGLHTEIPLIMNKEVINEIKRFQGQEKDFFIASYKRSGIYRPMIVKELKEAGLPEELSWLPLIESGFKVRALSRARALGLWQFIASTGYKFGLNRNTWIDERLDPEKSTHAAIAYLTELHKIFGDWMTVLAAYNCGEGTVLRVIRKQRINYLDHFWDLYQRLPYETVRYVPRFIATLLIIKDPEKFGFKLGEPDPPIVYDKVKINKQLHLSQIAKAIGVPKKRLKELNPELRYEITPPKGYVLRVPPEKKEALIAKMNELENWTIPKGAFVYHRVRRGENLSIIAMKYGSTVRDIALANNLKHRNLIRVGQRLKVPIKKKKKTYYAKNKGIKKKGSYKDRSKKYKSYNRHKKVATHYNRRHNKKSKTKQAIRYKLYRVKKGDSLWAIAIRNKTRIKKIKALNGLKSNIVKAGQLLKIPLN